MPFRMLAQIITILAFSFLYGPVLIHAQNKDEKHAERVKLEQTVAAAITLPEKIRNAGSLATFHFTRKNYKAGDSLIRLISEWATTSGKKEDMFAALRVSGSSYANSGDPGKAASYYLKALDYSIQQRMPNEEVVILSMIGRFYSNQRDFAKATEYYNLVDLNKEGIEDSTRYNYFYRKGYYFFAQGKRLEVIKNLFTARKYALATQNPRYIAEANQVLGGNFRELKEFEKAILYFQAAKQESEKINDIKAVLFDDNLIAHTYREMKDYPRAEKLFEDVIQRADAGSYFDEKYSAVVGLWMIYYDQNDLSKSVAAGKKYKLEEYYIRKNDSSSFCNIKALYEDIGGNQDSADLYYRRSIAYSAQYSSKINTTVRIYTYADYLKRYKRYTEALPQMKLTLALYDSLDDIRELPLVYQNLDSIYSALGDYKNAWEARGHQYFYRDSLDKLSKKEDILKDEITAEEERIKKAEEAEIKALERKHDIQYRIIVLGGILLLTSLLAIGFFHPPNWLIKGLTFVSFIVLFEFIILLLDTKLHHLFHGAPLPILGIKVLIACLLVPLHHFTEKRVIRFLQSKKLHRLKTVFKDPPNSVKTPDSADQTPLSS